MISYHCILDSLLIHSVFMIYHGDLSNKIKILENYDISYILLCHFYKSYPASTYTHPLIYSGLNEKYICFKSPDLYTFCRRPYLLKLNFDQFWKNWMGMGLGCFIGGFLLFFALKRLGRIRQRPIFIKVRRFILTTKINVELFLKHRLFFNKIRRCTYWVTIR